MLFLLYDNSTAFTIQEDAAACSPKEFTSVFYATLKESAVPDTTPQDLMIDFYAQLQGAAHHVGDEG